jgi:hypothetical protein
LLVVHQTEVVNHPHDGLVQLEKLLVEELTLDFRIDMLFLLLSILNSLRLGAVSTKEEFLATHDIRNSVEHGFIGDLITLSEDVLVRQLQLDHGGDGS